MESYRTHLSSKEKQVNYLSGEISEKEKEIAKLREELESLNSSSEHAITEQVMEKRHQLNILDASTIHLKLEQQKVENQTQRDRMKLYSAKQSLETCERIIVSASMVWVIIVL